MNGKELLSSLRNNALIARHAKFSEPKRVTPKGFVQIEKPISKRAAKSAGSKTMTLKVRNWQINAAHFN